MLSPKLEQRITEIKMKLLFNRNAAAFYLPYSHLPVHETFEVDTAATDGRQVLINPEFFNTLSDEDGTGVFTHEIFHNVLGHTAENKPEVKYPELMIQAEEIAVNNLVTECGINFSEDLKSKLSFDPSYKGWSTLGIYADLVKKRDPEDKNKQQQDNTVITGCAIPTPDKGGLPEEQLGEPLTDSLIRDNLNKVEQALKAAGATSNLLEPIGDLLRQLTTPKIDWTEELFDSFVKSFDGDVLDLSNPIKQYMPNIYVPMYKEENILNMYTAIDLSGSVTKEELGKAQDIMDEIRQLYSIEQTTVLTFNTRIINRFDFDETDDIKLGHFKGRGGTRIDCVFDYIAKNNEDPFTLLIITDTYDRVSTPMVYYPVIWLNSSKEPPFALYGRPNFGKFVDIHDGTFQ